MKQSGCTLIFFRSLTTNHWVFWHVSLIWIPRKGNNFLKLSPRNTSKPATYSAPFAVAGNYFSFLNLVFKLWQMHGKLPSFKNICFLFLIMHMYCICVIARRNAQLTSRPELLDTLQLSLQTFRGTWGICCKLNSGLLQQ